MSDGAAPRRILVRCPNPVGDAVMATPALRALRRIVNGYPFEEVQEPVIARGRIDDHHLQQCRELGMALAAGLEAGIY